MVDEHVLQTSSFGTSSFQSGMGNIWSSNSTKGDGSSISAMGSRLFVRSPEDVQDLSSRRSGEIKDITNEIQLSNWGCIGGIFLGLIYASVVFRTKTCLLYTSDAADEEDSVDLGGRRIIKKKKQNINIGASKL
eukprot:TRINITY_DN63003_c0_g1_i1.p1 TRINITY_DN63003_c0_g1~~TRINITY_DN63003_c0_g1_i1.p1  ORF type:complete len:134 (-),score=26.43 TRINITY_DN63003_c0_g1_i1:9-410(-)